MKRFVVLCCLVAWVLSASGCGLVIAGAIGGGVALKKRSARKDAVAQMNKDNNAAEQAMKAGDAAQGLAHYQKAQAALYGYTFKYERRAKLSSLAAEHSEIARTARGLVAANQALRNETAAAAIASQMMPPSEAAPVLKKSRVVQLKSEVVATAPHMYQGMCTQWHGEVSHARHDPTTNTMQLVVTPYAFQRRQVGMRSQRYYDHQLKLYRHRLVPSYRTFKLPLRHKAFTVELKGYHEQVVPGAAGTFFGRLEAGPLGVVLRDAVPVKLSARPGGRATWLLGVQVPTV